MARSRFVLADTALREGSARATPCRIARERPCAPLENDGRVLGQCSSRLLFARCSLPHSTVAFLGWECALEGSFPLTVGVRVWLSTIQFSISFGIQRTIGTRKVFCTCLSPGWPWAVSASVLECDCD